MKKLKADHNRNPNLVLAGILPILYRASGIDFNFYKVPTLQRAIHKRMQTLRLKSFEAYVRHLKNHPQEAQDLAQSMLIRVTQFFRDPAIFKKIRAKILPHILKEHAQGPVRIWVPGCATGEEVYSLAMALRDLSGDHNVLFHIFGTDLSEESLQKARLGLYKKTELKGLTKAQIGRYFKQHNDRCEIDKNIRSMCTFAKQNLTQDPPFSRLDLVSCRNVLIYLKPEVQEKIIRMFHYALNPHGYLVLGKSENTGSFHAQMFHLVDKTHGIYAKKRTLMRMEPGVRFTAPSQPPLLVPKAVKPLSAEIDVDREMERILIERTGHAAILVNEANDILQTKGNVGAYFRIPSGRMTFNMMKMAQDDLGIELKMLLQKAHKTQKIACKRIETGKSIIEAEVVVLTQPIMGERNYLVLLSPAASGDGALKKPHLESRQVANLRQELAATKAWMQTVIEEHDQNVEELKSAHEEVLSSNEELQSLNEELQTSKEELESTNEELTTVNEQLQQQMEALHQSEERFRILLESVRDYAIYILDEKGHVVTWNPGAERLKGYKAQEVIGQHFSKFYPKELKDFTATELRIAAQKGVFKGEGPRVRKDGSMFWARVVIAPLKDKTGHARGFAKVTYDMTEDKRKEEVLRESKERFRLMVDVVQDYAIFMLDPQGNVVTWNAGAERIKQYKDREIIGKNFSVFYTKGDRATGRPPKNLQEALEKGRVMDEGWRLRKDGSRFWAHVIITALKDSQGRLRGFAKIERDMTEVKQRQDSLMDSYSLLEKKVEERTAQLKEYTEELMRSNADLQQFAYVASHDLQEPLRMVSLYIDLIKRDLQGKTSKDLDTYFKFVQDGAMRSQRLIKELLEYSRIGTRNEPYTAVSMEEVLKHVEALMRVAIEENKVKITCDPLPTLYVDRFQMEQLFQNLISNAIKYKSRKPPRIHVSARLQNKEWLFKVQDNGIGIDPQYKDHIFVVFKRLHSHTDYPGTGIGLALCKKIIEAHGGKIWVESQLDKGAAFFFTVPERRPEGAYSDRRGQ